MSVPLHKVRALQRDHQYFAGEPLSEREAREWLEQKGGPAKASQRSTGRSQRKETGRFAFKFLAHESSAPASRLAAFFAKALGIETPRVRVFRDVESDERADFREDTRNLGYCNGASEIYVRAGLRGAELVGVVAHEVRHCYQHRHKSRFGSYGPSWESDASDYEARVKSALGVPELGELIVGRPPEHYGTASTLVSNVFVLSPHEGKVYRGSGYGPRPSWREYRTLDMRELVP